MHLFGCIEVTWLKIHDADYYINRLQLSTNLSVLSIFNTLLLIFYTRINNRPTKSQVLSI